MGWDVRVHPSDRHPHLLVDSLQKQEVQEERDAQGRFLKGVSGNPEGRFKPGQSGNPGGRPPGTRNKATENAELLLEGEPEALTRRALRRHSKAIRGRCACASTA